MNIEVLGIFISQGGSKNIHVCLLLLRQITVQPLVYTDAIYCTAHCHTLSSFYFCILLFEPFCDRHSGFDSEIVISVHGNIYIQINSSVKSSHHTPKYLATRTTITGMYFLMLIKPQIIV